MKSKKCPNCNHEFSGVKNFCDNCGTRLPHNSIANPRHDLSHTPAMSEGQLFGVLGLVSGIISLFVVGIVFGPAAIILGVLALNRRNNLGWAGIIIGGIVVFVTGIAFLLLVLE